mmetsp:Transcript_41882/g.45484  ORF Transcript_41882/g.45484 Transcript_41882/m.45484 type:complete len:99 (+) Transcript_41882:620-916(+)
MTVHTKAMNESHWMDCWKPDGMGARKSLSRCCCRRRRKGRNFKKAVYFSPSRTNCQVNSRYITVKNVDEEEICVNTRKCDRVHPNLLHLPMYRIFLGS